MTPGQLRQRLSHPITRRRFLSGAAATSLAAVMAGDQSGVASVLDELRRDAGLEASPSTDVIHQNSTFQFSVDRESDLALMDFSLTGFHSELSSGVRVLRAVNAANLIVVTVPPQVIAEAAYTPTTSLTNFDPAPTLSALPLPQSSPPSQLCFTLDAGQAIRFPHMVAAELLDWSEWTLLVPDAAKAHGTGDRSASPHTPAKVVSGSRSTFIEAPYALFLSPVVDSAHGGYHTTFLSSATPNVGPSPNAVTECWTAVLQATTNHGEALTPFVAAVWAADYLSGNATPESSISY